jgi:superfamily I DNA/RNA helicase
MKLTTEQIAIRDNIPSLIRANKSVLIDAKAGSGKTFAITDLIAPNLPSGGFCLAFNREIADTLQKRLPPHIRANTFHGLGLALLRDRFPVKVDSRKLHALAKDLKIKDPFPYIDLINHAKTAGLGLANLPPLTEQNLAKLRDLYDIQFTESDNVAFNTTIRLFKKSLQTIKTIDFGDMLYLPLHLADKHKWKFDQYPYLLIDEAQDVSPLRLEMIKRLTSTILAVGDPYQAIYGFAGAISGAMDDIATHFNAETYPLSISFRCPKEITSYASGMINSPIRSLPEAIDGAVKTIKERDFTFPTSPNQAVLCRTNKPLFVLALRMMRDGFPFNFRSDMPAQLIRFVKRFKAKTLPELKTRIMGWFEEATERFDKGQMTKGAYALTREKHDTLLYLITQVDSPDTLITLLNEISLAPSTDAPTLSTIHKAKGLEWDFVYVIRPDLIPAPFATTPEDLKQENNIHYVAVTRAKDTLIYVEKD